jgi:DNA-binding transcriptional MerR regulator
MANYTIRDLESITGIKAHTIRIWEKRYGIVRPSRTDTNIRYYSDNELKRLLNVSILNAHGVKISKISRMDEQRISQTLTELVRHDGSHSTQIDSLMVAMVDLDRARFEKIIADCSMRFGFEETCTSILFPFMSKVGLMWQTDRVNPAQEHFISNLIKQKLFVAIDSLYSSSPKGPRCLVFLKEGEMHELGILFARYLLKKQGFEAIYLGQSVPYADLLETIAAFRPQMLMTSFVAAIQPEDLKEYIDRLCSDFTGPVLLFGAQMGRLTAALPANATYLTDAAALKTYAEGAVKDMV